MIRGGIGKGYYLSANWACDHAEHVCHEMGIVSHGVCTHIDNSPCRYNHGVGIEAGCV